MQLQKAKKGWWLYLIKKYFNIILKFFKFFKKEKKIEPKFAYYFGHPGPQISRFLKRTEKKKNYYSRYFNKRGFINKDGGTYCYR